MPGLVAFLTNGQIAAQEAAAEAAEKTEAERKDEALIGQIGAYIQRCWQAAYNAKQQHQMEMLSALRAVNGEYEPQKLAEIREFGGHEIYMPLTGSITRTAYAWLRDVEIPDGGRGFSVEPTPVPDLPPDVTEQIVTETLQEAAFAAQMSGMPVPPAMVEARAKARYDQTRQRIDDEAKLRNARMEARIDDAFTEGGFYEALDAALVDIVSLKLGCVKGPVFMKKKTLQWVQKDGSWTAQVDEQAKPTYYRVSPLDMYPAPNAKCFQRGFFFERISYTRGDLFAMIGEKGYDEKRLRAALEDYERGYDLNLAYDQERERVEGNEQYRDSPEKTIDGLEFYGQVRGKWLVEWGMDKTLVPDEDREYNVTALQIGRFTVKCLLNEDPLGERPYNVAYYDKPTSGGVWGQGIPWLIRDLQAMVNACARALANNLGMGSMPLMEVEIDRLAEGQELKGIYPGMIVQTKSNVSGAPGPAVRFTTVPIAVQAMMEVFKYFSALASQFSGIPSYEQGVNPKSGAAGTARGLSMLMNAVTRQFKATVKSADGIIEGCARRTYNNEMQYGTDPMAKGDLNVKALGTSAILVREQQQMQRAEFLAQTNNPLDAQIITPDRRAEILRSVAEGLDLPDAVPGKEEMVEKMRAAAMQAVGLQQQPASAPQGQPANPVA